MQNVAAEIRLLERELLSISPRNLSILTPKVDSHLQVPQQAFQKIRMKKSETFRGESSGAVSQLVIAGKVCPTDSPEL